LRARDELNEIRSADLRFTPDETSRFLNHTMGLNLSVEDVMSLEQYTEGWIAGLQLAGLALQSHDRQSGGTSIPSLIQALTGSHRHIVNYLVEEVLSQRPRGTLDFLLQTSILETLSGPLCDHVLGKPPSYSQSILEQLEHANLFLVPLDEEGKWYRYHHLFADVLQARLQFAQPGKLRELHRRASEWYEQSGALPESVRHAVEAGELERAARLAEHHAMSLGNPSEETDSHLRAQHPEANAARLAPLDKLAEPLSDRELEVLLLIAAGASNASISETLHIALSTVKRHAGNLYGKLGVNSRTQAVARSQRLGLIS
jgi:LuxR family maltose regulon positive regulatory protein